MYVQAYGIVWKAHAKETNKTVALKKIFDAFRNRIDAQVSALNDKLFQRTYREIFFLKSFNDHPNVVKLYGIFKAENKKDIYLVFEYMGLSFHNTHYLKRN